jgi:hypothetical protein
MAGVFGKHCRCLGCLVCVYKGGVHNSVLNILLGINRRGSLVSSNLCYCLVLATAVFYSGRIRVTLLDSLLWLWLGKV